MPKQPAKASKKKIPFRNEFTYLLVVLGTIILFLLTTFNLNRYFDKQKVLGSSTVISSSNNEIAFWEVFLYENEDYIEGWFELARLKIDEGDISGARQALIEVEKISPNSEKLMKLRNSL
jgi:cytochrome c-type biogenesis protein CcmH/NrfG